MNKQLLAMAVAAAMFAPAVASADVKVFGRVQVEYNVEDSDSSDSVQSVDDDGGQSRIGVKFSEKLGGGMTAFGLLAWKIDPADHSTAGGGDALQARQQFVGLKSSWGSIAAGSFHSPYKTAGGVKWDPWTATHLQARRAGGMTGGPGIGGHNGFMRNSIYYTSPNVNGFKVQFAIAPDETADADTANDNEDSDNDYSLAVQYKNGPWHAIFAHNRNNNDEVNEDETLTKVGLRWKSGAWTLAGQYEDVSDADQSRRSKTPGLNVKYRPDNGGDMDLLWLNAQYKAGNNIFTASYGTMDIDNTDGTDADVDYWAVGAIHKFSKKTRIFGGYTETDGDNMFDDRDAWTVGIRHDF